MEAETELDYTGCYYEGDMPETVLTDMKLVRISLADILKGMSTAQLKALGLQRL